MAMTLDDLKKRLEEQKLRYYLHPERPQVMLGVQGVNGSYQFVIHLELDGTFLQFRSIQYLKCPKDHPHLAEVLAVLATINYERRLTKLSWDKNDGEIVAYADAWLMDAALTTAQFGQYIASYFSTVDLAYARIGQTMQTGKDPGTPDLEALARAAASGPDEI